MVGGSYWREAAPFPRNGFFSPSFRAGLSLGAQRRVELPKARTSHTPRSREVSRTSEDGSQYALTGTVFQANSTTCDYQHICLECKGRKTAPRQGDSYLIILAGSCGVANTHTCSGPLALHCRMPGSRVACSPLPSILLGALPPFYGNSSPMWTSLPPCISELRAPQVMRMLGGLGHVRAAAGLPPPYMRENIPPTVGYWPPVSL